MLRPRSPIDAYRTDLASARGLSSFGDDDGHWLLVAELLSRVAAVLRAPPEPRGEGDRVLRADALLADLFVAVGVLASRPSHETSGDAGDVGEIGGVIAGTTVTGHPTAPDASSGRSESPRPSAQAVVHAVLPVASAMERSGALHLAYGALDALRAVAGDSRVRAPGVGLALAQQARVARKAGALDTARDLYDEAARLGRSLGDHDVVARAALGQAVVARRRGNYPASRERYRLALRVAARAGLRELVGLAHHGLLIAAGAAGDVATALRHGWMAYQWTSGAPERQADVLANLGAVSSAAGYYHAGLRAYLGAASRSPLSRVRLPAFGGAAVCAARLRDRAQLDAATKAVTAELTRTPLPYERSQALLLLAEAWADYEPSGAGEPYRAQARELAEAYGFHEFAIRAAALARVASRVRRGPERDAEAEQESAASRDGEAGWLAAARSEPPDWTPAERARHRRGGVLRALERLDAERVSDSPIPG